MPLCAVLSLFLVAPQQPAETELRGVIRQIDAALASHDRAALERLIGAGFAMLHSTGTLEPRQSFIDRAAAGSLLSQRVPSELVDDEIRLYGDATAIRTTRARAHIPVPGGPAAEMELRSIDVYARVGGRWTWVSEQSTPVPHQDASVAADARKAIAAANADWIPALKKHDADAVAAPYAEDGIFVTATGEVHKGRAAVAQLMRDRLATMGTVVDGTLVQDGLTRQGSLIYEWGHADLVLASGAAAPRHSRGRYLTVWHQGPGDRWEIVRNLSLPE